MPEERAKLSTQALNALAGPSLVPNRAYQVAMAALALFYNPQGPVGVPLRARAPAAIPDMVGQPWP